MPRIKAASVAEHVAEQEAAVFAAAIRLFEERGYDHVSLGDIAAEVGLARNSLYRYFPTKAHILARWFEQEHPRQIAEATELLGGDGPAAERIERWALANLDYAQTPQHRLVVELAGVAPDLDPETRAKLADSHRGLVEPLDAALAEAGLADPAERTVVADLLTRFVVAAGESAGQGAAEDVVRRRLTAAIGALLG